MLSKLFSAACTAALFCLAASPGVAVMLPIGGGGIDVGFACLSSAGSCSEGANFSTDDRGSVSGSISIVGTGLTTADVVLSIPSTRMSGFFEGVSEIAFTSVTIAGSIPVMASGDMGSTFQVISLGVGSGEVNGSYDEGSGPNSIPGLLAELANLQCLWSAGVGQCGVQVGREDFDLEVGGESHDFVWLADLTIVPEPGTGWMLGLGLVGLAVAGRCRA
jgi:hypothetical protein